MAAAIISQGNTAMQVFFAKSAVERQHCWFNHYQDLAPQWLGAVDRSGGSEIRKSFYDTANRGIPVFPETGFPRAG